MAVSKAFLAVSACFSVSSLSAAVRTGTFPVSFGVKISVPADVLVLGKRGTGFSCEFPEPCTLTGSRVSGTDVDSLSQVIRVSVAQLLARWTHDRKVVGSVVNNTFKKYSQYQYIYSMKKVLPILIPINELQKYAILSPILFFVKTVNFKKTCK